MLTGLARHFIPTSRHFEIPLRPETHRIIIRWRAFDFMLPRHVNDVIQPSFNSSSDPSWFPAEPITAASSDNWVIKYNILKKTLAKLTQFLEQHLHLPHASTRLAMPDNNAIAKLGSAPEICKYIVVLLVAAIKCARNQDYVAIIQSELAPEFQHQLMPIIADAMERLSKDPTPSTSTAPTTDATDGLKKDILRLQDELKKSNDRMLKLQSQHQEETDRLKRSLEDQKTTRSSGDQQVSIVVIKTELDQLKVQLAKSEAKRSEHQDLIDQQTNELIDARKRLDDATVKLASAAHLKDEVDEYKHAAEKMEKMEQSLEKYKKKMDEANELRRQLKSLEEQSQIAIERNVHLEEEYKKAAALKPVVDEYKEQLAAAERKVSELTAQKEKLEKNHTSTQDKTDDTDYHYQEQIAALEERLHEYELMGGLPSSGGLDQQLTVNSDKVAELRDNVEKLTLSNSEFKKADNCLQLTLNEQIAKNAELEASNARQKEIIRELQSKQQLESVVPDDGSDNDFKSKLKTAASKIIQLTDQSASLHRALKKAKEHIIEQDAQLKEAKLGVSRDNNTGGEQFNEAVASLQTQVKEKDHEVLGLKKELRDTQIHSRREQDLMSSVWYDLSINQQRRTNNNHTSSPSWLSQQRRNLYNF